MNNHLSDHLKKINLASSRGTDGETKKGTSQTDPKPELEQNIDLPYQNLNSGKKREPSHFNNRYS